MREEWKTYLTAATKMIVVAVLFGEAFGAMGKLLRLLQHAGVTGTAWSPFAATTAVHLIVLGFATGIWKVKIPGLRSGRETTRSQSAAWIAGAGPGWLIVVATGAWLSRTAFPGATPADLRGPDWTWWLTTVLVAPLLEELIYRGIIANSLRRDAGNMVGGYLAAILFAWVHTTPSLTGILQGNWGGVPPGPLLLALIADWLYVKSGSIWPAVAFHAACNATPAVFGLIDARWLVWLGALYQ